LPNTSRAPFRYLSTGIETRFANYLDPEPKSRQLFHFHRPELLSGWLSADPLEPSDGKYPVGPGALPPSTFRSRLKVMPPLATTGLWPAQIKAVQNLETSLREDHPRALIQMATGSGKTFTAISSVYRLVKYAGARRVLFLVDRANLGRQAHKEFQHYTTPDDGRKVTELYNVQHLTSNRIDPVARVVITTIQRLYSMLQGQDDLDPTQEEGSQFDTGGGLVREPVPVAYNPAILIETFDVVFIDECHRSIYSLWRQVLEYFDAAHFRKYQLQPGDIVVSEGKSPELVGQSAIYRGAIRGIYFQKTLHRFRSVPGSVPSEFAQIVFRAHVKSGVFMRLASITTNIAHLTLEKFKASPFPVPPLAEQHRIVAEVERRLSVVDELEATVEKNLARCARLRQAILKLAFEGRLVPQDPNDESASVLLDRIRRERESVAAACPPRKREKAARV